ncbi:unnamed protein product [Enterobius vermicularis]|uniref:Hydrophobin n=1 Tax=Enterobius vermicularis TaxID=51028 RepID=A0A0N4VCD4_ENTVE|nr:unnamed protein product [Enterobius vermicularis]
MRPQLISATVMAQNHVDVDALLEDYAWKHFNDIQSIRRTRMDEFKNLEREDVEFVMVGIAVLSCCCKPQIPDCLFVGCTTDFYPDGYCCCGAGSANATDTFTAAAV